MAVKHITIIGAGLAGSEAAWQAANRGVRVNLYEMRPDKKTPAHHTGYFAELVCSNSLRANHLQNAAGLLKEELRKLDSLLIQVADNYSVPAGRALAVDRELFSQKVTEKLLEHPNIIFYNQEVAEIPTDQIVIIATGPLTSDRLIDEIQKLTGEEYLHFFDAAAPIVTKESLNLSKVFRASRYEENGGDYLNCPMNLKQYGVFWENLIRAERHPLNEFEEEKYFEGCLPIEVMAERGQNTLLFGPLKPVGLVDPTNGQQPFAVVQLRQDNSQGTLYNMVGFQTRLKWGEQERVFRMIPGMEAAEIVRYGVMHRNTFINSPKILKPTFNMRSKENIFFAGQITGVEGYIESTASGLIAGINAVRHLKNEEPLIFPDKTAIGALSFYISDKIKDKLQPMNINFGLLPPLEKRIKNKWERKGRLSERALSVLKDFIEKDD